MSSLEICQYALSTHRVVVYQLIKFLFSLTFPSYIALCLYKISEVLQTLQKEFSVQMIPSYCQKEIFLWACLFRLAVIDIVLIGCEADVIKRGLCCTFTRNYGTVRSFCLLKCANLSVGAKKCSSWLTKQGQRALWLLTLQKDACNPYSAFALDDYALRVFLSEEQNIRGGTAK